MFVQVVQGKVGNVDGLRAAIERWYAEIAPQVPSWLGSTGGMTADGTAIVVARFESEEAARRNSDRPEQQQWWAEASRHFAGEVTFHDCTETLTFLDGGSDDAGFVQIIQGHVDDVDRLRRMMAESADSLREYRPEIIGGLVALHGDGGFTQVVYFTSEEAARQGERKEAPPQMRELDEAIGETLADATFFDLTRPWMHSPS